VKKGRADALYLPADDKGIVQPDKLEKALIQLQNRGYSSQSQLVSVMLANNEIGTIQPIKELTEISRKYGALFHTDAVQAVGHIPINVNDLGVSMLSASAHKFNGPKGVGFLYSKERLDSFIDGGSQEKGHRAGTENVAGIVGMAAALKKNTAHIVENSTKLKKLEKQLMEALHSSNIDFLRNGTRQLPGNVSLSFAGADGEMIFHRMDLMHIFISTGSACNSGSTDVSHVISAIGVPDYYAKGTIRISLGIDNTDQDITEIVRALSSIINK
jgi:cysteine desulfurase